ncbi:Uma2 family endonuclease [Chamaesiphon sp. OTE_75_metabat_556]|uniref:Uma2 family endonuclease n=1 Tax=Chamaesiphon sp. OTE_75_metabat_556 TaxID=2964692 RepID=UPI00286A39B7|nr:Uma2 family endonuclease [Chamaesiphon sp. OTE_75_metabat_556]
MATAKTLTNLDGSPSQIVIESPHNLKYWTVQDYHRMSDLGILDPNQRTELIAGQIVLMTAKGTPHVLTLRLLATALENALGDRSAIFVSTQDPIRLDNFSEPELDLAIVKGSILDYDQAHPGAEDIYLVIEIADSTLKQDCEVKDKLYARSNIAEYWVVDIKNRQVRIFRDPTPTGYGSQLILTETHSVSPLAFPEITLSINSILPSV